MVHISNITTLKSVYYAYFHSLQKTELWDNSSNSRKIFTLHKKIELWLVHNPEPLVEVCSYSQRFCPFHASTYYD